MKNCLFVTLAVALGIISLCIPSRVESQNQAESRSSQAEAGKTTTKNLVNQSVSGTLYTNGATRFTLTVPQGWKANDNLVEPRAGVGALTAPDGEANLLIQLILTSDSTKTFAKKIDAQGNSLFAGYHKVSESKMNVAGRDCEVLTLKYTEPRTVAGLAVEMPMVSRLVLVPKEYGFLVFNFVTHASLFDQKLPTFDKIIGSYRSTDPDDTITKPNAH
jgi:hypothetical protein